LFQVSTAGSASESRPDTCLVAVVRPEIHEVDVDRRTHDGCRATSRLDWAYRSTGVAAPGDRVTARRVRVQPLPSSDRPARCVLARDPLRIDERQRPGRDGHVLVHGEQPLHDVRRVDVENDRDRRLRRGARRGDDPCARRQREYATATAAARVDLSTKCASAPRSPLLGDKKFAM